MTRIARAIVREEHSVLPVSAYVNGHYGVSDVYFGVPSIVGAEGVEKVLDIPLDGSEQQQLEHSVDSEGCNCRAGFIRKHCANPMRCCRRFGLQTLLICDTLEKQMYITNWEGCF